MSDLDRLRELTEQVRPPSLDALVETAHRRDRRGVAAVTAACAAVVLVVGGGLLLSDGSTRSAPDPANTPDVDVTTRPLTYADGVTIHYGDQTIEAAGPVQEVDVTDDGVAFRTSDGRIWFTDGTAVDELGALGEPSEPGPDYERHWTQSYRFFPVPTSAGWVVSGNSGSHVAWFEFPEPDAPEVVVYDTRAREVVVRTQVSVEPGSWVAPHSVDDESAYFFLDPDPFADDQMPQVRLDLTTDAQAPVSPQDYLADVGKRPARTLEISHQENGFSLYEITDGAAWNFGVEGGRVEPQGMQPLQVRDALTGKRFAFDAPAEYPRSNEVWLVQWLDDDTVVLLSTEGEGNDLIECHVSTRACQIAVSGPDSLVAPELG